MLKTFYELEYFLTMYELKEFLEKRKIKPRNIIVIEYVEGRWRLLYKKVRGLEKNRKENKNASEED